MTIIPPAPTPWKQLKWYEKILKIAIPTIIGIAVFYYLTIDCFSSIDICLSQDNNQWYGGLFK